MTGNQNLKLKNYTKKKLSNMSKTQLEKFITRVGSDFWASSKYWDSHSIAYSGFMIDTNSKKWYEYAGRCFLVGIRLDFKLTEIVDYIFESYHSCNLKEITFSNYGIAKDMLLYSKRD